MRNYKTKLFGLSSLLLVFCTTTSMNTTAKEANASNFSLCSRTDYYNSCGGYVGSTGDMSCTNVKKVVFKIECLE